MGRRKNKEGNKVTDRIQEKSTLKVVTSSSQTDTEPDQDLQKYIQLSKYEEKIPTYAAMMKKIEDQAIMIIAIVSAFISPVLAAVFISGALIINRNAILRNPIVKFTIKYLKKALKFITPKRIKDFLRDIKLKIYRWKYVRKDHSILTIRSGSEELKVRGKTETLELLKSKLAILTAKGSLPVEIKKDCEYDDKTRKDFYKDNAGVGNLVRKLNLYTSKYDYYERVSMAGSEVLMGRVVEVFKDSKTIVCNREKGPQELTI